MASLSDEQYLTERGIAARDEISRVGTAGRRAAGPPISASITKVSAVQSPYPGRVVPASLRYVTLSLSPEEPLKIDCLECGRPVENHQPDADLPDRMLGTCEFCRAWHMILHDSDSSRALVLLFPDPGLFRGLLEA